MATLRALTERQLEILTQIMEFAILNQSKLLHDIRRMIAQSELIRIQDMFRQAGSEVARDSETFGPEVEVSADIEIIKGDDDDREVNRKEGLWVLEE